MSTWRTDIEVQRLREALDAATARTLAAERRSTELYTVLDKINDLLCEAGFNAFDDWDC